MVNSILLQERQEELLDPAFLPLIRPVLHLPPDEAVSHSTVLPDFLHLQVFCL